MKRGVNVSVKKKFVGLNTYLYTFSLKEREKYHSYMDRLKKTGQVTVVFINNGYAFEHKKFRRVY